jgi:teichuronic acid biosynthesis glycosyltransferase TuaH
MVASPTTGFPAGVAGTRILFVTDDWVSGAPMMGLSGSFVRRTLRRNLAASDYAAAVSPHLAESLESGFPAAVDVLPNGCDLPARSLIRGKRSANAILVGQLNERLDMDVLEAVGAAGVPLLVIGPRTDRRPETGRRLDTFLSSQNVTWLGELPPEELGTHLATAGVGLTPYADSAFNRASFPLKTLDYLAAGVPVVATDLPAVRWLDTDLVTIGKSGEDFAIQVRRVLAARQDPADEERRRQFAGLHTWEARATQLLELVGAHTAGREASSQLPARPADPGYDQ